MARKKIVHDKTCDVCERPFQATDSRRKRCDVCMQHSEIKHRNVQRAKSLPKMFVSVDGEGKQDGEIMNLVTLSIGREDGSSATHIVGDGGVQAALRWLIDQVHDRYVAPDGTEYKQVVVAFHFGWDFSTIMKEFDLDKMFLIRKAQANIETALCGSVHKNWDDCPLLDVENAEAVKAIHQHLEEAAESVSRTTGRKIDVDFQQILHRYNPHDVLKVVSKGGEGDIIAFDPESELAISRSKGRRVYVEHRPHGDRFNQWRRADIHDTGSCFFGGLEKVIADWNPELTDQQRAIIKWGKEHRKDGSFDFSVIDKIVEYSEAECVAHARVCRIILDLMRDVAHVSIKERELFGSGSIAGATLKQYKVPTRKESDLGPEDIGQLTYFGGMIETPVIGLVKGLTDEVDINSAYPDKMVGIPCPRKGCGTWEKGGAGYLPQEKIGHVRVRWFIDSDTSTPPFIVRRSDGRVGMPKMMDKPTWVTLAECQAAVERFGDDIEIVESVYWAPDCQCGNPTPFKFLEELYNKRLGFKKTMKGVEARLTEEYETEVGKSRSEFTEDNWDELGEKFRNCTEWMGLSCREKIVKLVINSIYGKLAQQDPTPGKYTNLNLASYITGATRAQVRREAWAREDQGGTVVYQHTDSVLSIGGTPKNGGKKLGAWGMEKPSKDFLIVQAGLATARGGGKQASRGCRLGAFQDAVDNWITEVDMTTQPTTWPKLRTEQTVMTTWDQAVAWGKPWLAGSFRPKVTEISVVSPKRDIENAHQMPGNPTAWIVPPLDYIEDAATYDDVMRMRKGFREARERGEYDN